MLAPHSWHRWYAALSWYLPDGQWKQLVWPAQVAYLPVSHAKHSCHEDGWYLPTGQSLQAADCAIANWPSAQEEHPSALYTAANLPAMHGVQTLNAALSRNLPGVHAGVGYGVGYGVG